MHDWIWRPMKKLMWNHEIFFFLHLGWKLTYFVKEDATPVQVTTATNVMKILCMIDCEDHIKTHDYEKPWYFLILHLGWKLTYFAKEDATPVQVTTATNVKAYTMTGLSTGQGYVVSVKGYTSQGDGPISSDWTSTWGSLINPVNSEL